MLRVKTFSGCKQDFQESAAQQAEDKMNEFLEANPGAIIYKGQLQTAATTTHAEDNLYYDFTITALFNLPDEPVADTGPNYASFLEVLHK